MEEAKVIDSIKVESMTDGTIRITVKGDNDSYSSILGLLAHAQMQITCRYNKDEFEPFNSDDDIFKTD